MKFAHLLILTSLAAALVTASAHAAVAAVTEKDVLVIARLVSLLDGAPKGRVEIAVLRDGPESIADADGFIAQIGSGKQVGDVTLVAVPVSTSELAATNAKVILIPAGVEASYFDVIFSAAQKKQILTISNSDACLVAKRCAIAIKTDPAVNINMSQSAAHATGVSFGSTMRMMVKEMP